MNKKKKKPKEFYEAQRKIYKMDANISIASTFNYPDNTNSKFIYVLQNAIELKLPDKYELAVSNIHYSEVFQKICLIECFGINNNESKSIQINTVIENSFTQLISQLNNENLEKSIEFFKNLIKEFNVSLNDLQDINKKYYIMKIFYVNKINFFMNMNLIKSIQNKKLIDSLNNILNAYEISLKNCAKLIKNDNKIDEFYLYLKNDVYFSDNNDDIKITNSNEKVTILFNSNVYLYKIHKINCNAKFNEVNNSIINIRNLEFELDKLINVNHIYMHCNLIKNNHVYKCKQVIKSFKYNINNLELECKNLEYFEIIFNYISQIEIFFTDQDYNLIEFTNPTYLNLNLRKQKCRSI